MFNSRMPDQTKRAITSAFVFFMILAFIAGTNAVHATSEFFKKKPDPVDLDFEPAKTAKAGQTIETRFEIEIQPDFHIFSQTPEIKGIVATELKFEKSPLFTIEKVVFPKPTPSHSAVFGRTLNFYEKEIVVSVFVKLDPSIKSTDVPLKGTLSFQACSNSLCLRPMAKEFSFVQKIGS